MSTPFTPVPKGLMFAANADDNYLLRRILNMLTNGTPGIGPVLDDNTLLRQILAALEGGALTPITPVNLLPLNNDWTGTNTFEKAVTTNGALSTQAITAAGAVTANGALTAAGINSLTGPTTVSGHDLVLGGGNGGNTLSFQSQETGSVAGTLVLNGATNVVVPTTAVTANSLIFLTIQIAAGNLGHPRLISKSAGVSFTVASDSLDTSTMAWFLIQAIPGG